MKTAQAQNIFHGGVGQVKRAERRARIRVDQPAVFTDTVRARPVNTKSARTKKHSSKRRLQQITSWVDDPLMLQLREHAHDKKLSMSEAIRGLLREMMNQKLGKQHQAALPELIEEATAKAYRRLAARLAFFLTKIIFAVEHTKVLATNTLGMQKGMTQEMLRDIVQDADRRTKASLSRANPELTDLIKVVEGWLLKDEEDQTEPTEETNGRAGKGGRGL